MKNIKEIIDNIKKKAAARVQKKLYEKSTMVAHLPSEYPVDETGREVLLSIKNVDITFGKGDNAVRAVKNASFDIYRGETFSLVGESGSGKTTVGRAVIRVNPCAAGEIDYRGVRISGKIKHSLDREVIRNVQMVFQDPAASLNERATVDYIVSEGLYNFHLFENEADRVAKVERMITEVGLLPEHLTRYPHEFSGGQRQRIGLARAMIMEPELVVADEPISALDVSIRAQVLNLMNKFKAERNVTYLFIAHDLSIVRFISDRIGVIYKGVIVEVSTAEELFNYPLHPYTRSLISAIPIPDPKLEKNKVLYTYDPDMHDYSQETPTLHDIGHGHFVYGSTAEIEECKRIREAGVPLNSSEFQELDAFYHSIDTREEKKAQTETEARATEQSAEAEQTAETGKAPEAEAVQSTEAPKAVDAEEKAAHEKKKAEKIASDSILDRPIHDTGSKWYAFLSFILPILGIIAAILFRKKNYIRNYKKCKRGAITGFIVIGVLLAIFGFFLLLTLR